MQSAQRCRAIDPAAFDRDDDGHHAETGTADPDKVVDGIAGGLLAITRKAADGVCALPKKARRLPLDKVQQRVVIEIIDIRGKSGNGR
jgi:hypothetical protein